MSVEVTQPSDVQAGKVPALRETFTTINVFDSLDRPIRTTDNLGQTSRTQYDSRDNVIVSSNAKHSPDANDLIADPLGLMTSARINRVGNLLENFFDGLGRKLADAQQLRVDGQGKNALDTGNLANPDGLVVQDYAYDLNSNLIARADDGTSAGDQNTSVGVIESANPKGNVTRYLYDDLNRMVTEILDDGTRKALRYDADDNLVEMVDENGSVTTNVYDGLHRVVRRQATSASTAVIGTTLQEFEYDGLSRLTRSLDNNFPDDANDDAVVSRAYDSLSRLLDEVQNGLPISSRWSGSGDRLGLVYPNGRALTMSHDRHGRMDTITDAEHGLIADFDYVGSLRVLECTYGNGVKLSYLDGARQRAAGYDAGPRVVELKHLAQGGSLIAGFSYQYDRTNNRTSELRLHEQMRDDFDYDSLDRLTAFARQDQQAVNWQLDGANNWAQSQGQANQVNALHEYEHFQGKLQTYDENGNLLDNGTLRFQYDADNRLRRVLRGSDGALIAEHVYDAQGRRTAKTVSNSGALDGVTVYLYDGWQEIEERKGAQIQQYVYGMSLDEPLALIQDQNGDGTSENTFYYHQDDQLNVVALTDEAGSLVERATYDAYGVPSLTESATGNPFLYTGRRYEPEISQYYFRARFYDPQQGRFLQRAPEPSWMVDYELGNPYVYGNSSPVNWVDPLGLPTPKSRRDVILKTSVAVGASSCGAVQPLLGFGRGQAWSAFTGSMGSPCVCGGDPTAIKPPPPKLPPDAPRPTSFGSSGGGSDQAAGVVNNVFTPWGYRGAGGDPTAASTIVGHTTISNPSWTPSCCGYACSCQPPGCECGVNCSCNPEPGPAPCPNLKGGRCPQTIVNNTN